MSEGKKDDTGKAPWSLFPWDAGELVVKVLQFGASNYGERNWENGLKYSRVHSALHRHIKSWWQDREDNDPQTGLPHLAHAGCCVLFLLSFHVRGRTDLDDRPKTQRLEPTKAPQRPEPPKAPELRKWCDDNGKELQVGDIIYGKGYQGEAKILELKPSGTLEVELLSYHKGDRHTWHSSFIEFRRRPKR
jgi:hypothetical protein